LRTHSHHAVTNHTRQPLRFNAELEPVTTSGGGSSCHSIHSSPFDIPYSSFTIDALSTVVLPVVFVPLQATASSTRLILRKLAGFAGDSCGDEANMDNDEFVAITVTGRGCRGLLSISRSDSLTSALPCESIYDKHCINVRNRIGLPLPFVVTQSGTVSISPSRGCIPAYGSITLIACGDGGTPRGCKASICIVHELLECSFKSALLS
jgi:hypothetical protein